KGHQLGKMGDRHFGAGNLKRAADRYDQAARTDPDSAAPRVRQAQIAIARGQYAEAAERFREAVSVNPTWLAKAPDIQSIYAEPGDFTKTIARLEAHLLNEPTDRAAWRVLGPPREPSAQTARAAA